MTDIRRVGDSGIHTVEGVVAGEAAAKFAREREIEQQKYEAIKNKIKENNSTKLGRIDDKFSSETANLEDEFRNRTVGLITAQEYRNAREEINQQQKKSSQVDLENEMKIQELKKEIKKQDKALKRKKMKSSLSFMTNEEEEDLEGVSVGDGIGEGEINLPLKKKIAKNPDVDTSHLPDRERDERLKQEKERLTQEWLAEQEIIKNQVSSPPRTQTHSQTPELPLKMVEVVYSYWDGTGHRKAIEVKKGCTIGQFLSFVKVQLSDEFTEIRNISPEDMMYVKEDLIIPQVLPSAPSLPPSSHLPKHITFYDLIITRARGKSGPLFHFDVHDDVRLIQDVRVEKDESHPGKVLERRWYERNKHIFPASRWEVFDPSVDREGKGYTIRGDIIQQQK